MERGVVIVDADSSMRQFHQAALVSMGHFSCVSHATAAPALAAIAANEPLAVVLGVPMPDIDAIECLRRIRGLRPTAPVVIMSIDPDPVRLIHAFREGASGFLERPVSPDLLVRAISHVSSGEPFLSPVMSQLLLKFFRQTSVLGQGASTLSWREQEALGWIWKGFQLKEAADRMGISVAKMRPRHLLSVRPGLSGEERED